jgi:CDP-diacylglycerol--glycerol-3-phosphate 3-phosphatidyltransferase
MLGETGRTLLQKTLGPIAARMPHVNPNVVTVSAFFLSVLAGGVFALTDRSPLYFLLAAGLGCVYGFLDALDGVLARMHGKETPWGDFLDHSLDRLSALFALGGLTLTRHCNDRLVLLLMIGTLFHGYLGTQIEASFHRRIYRGLGIAESIGLVIVYSITAFAVRAAGLPFYFREPVTGRVLSVTDTFIIATLPLVVLGAIQRFRIAREISRDPGAAGAEEGRS